jgi:hypothetical protein
MNLVSLYQDDSDAQLFTLRVQADSPLSPWIAVGSGSQAESRRIRMEGTPQRGPLGAGDVVERARKVSRCDARGEAWLPSR